MIKPFKSKKELAHELHIHPKTLGRYMAKLGIIWNKKEPMPPVVWEKVVENLNQENSPAFSAGGGGEKPEGMKLAD